ncbi:MAG: hypothetical protein RML12_02520 [Xanthomonadales bacterium]|nr:hypothetical protein [Xanthomonadales bacterium]
MSRHPFILAAVLLAALLAACAGAPRKASSSPEEAVAQRAKERWEHLMKGRIDEALGYIAPGSRALIDRESYVAQKRNAPVMYTGVEVLEVRCEQEACTAELKVHTQAPLPFAGMVPAWSFLRERWVRDGGTWYLVPDP